MSPAITWAVRMMVIAAAVAVGATAAWVFVSREARERCARPAAAFGCGVDEDRQRLLTIAGGVGGALVGTPASWLLTRRPGERYWLD